MVLGSAVAFGTLSIFAKLAYAVGLGTEQLLAFRFVIAGAGMIGLAFVVGQSPFRLERRRVAALVAIGSVMYPAQAITYFTALRTLPASLCILIVYIYPSLVVVAGWLFLHRPISAWHAIALLASFAGVVLLVGGARFELSAGLLFAFASPVLYAAFILVSERAMANVAPVAASAVMMSSTGVVMSVIAALLGHLVPPDRIDAWAVSFGIAVVPTMIAISLFLAGLPRVGAARAALLSTIELVVTITLAVLLLGDRFSFGQVLGGVLVVAAVLVVQAAQMSRPAPTAALK